MKALEVWFYRQMAIWVGLFKRDDLSLEYWERLHRLRPHDAKVLATIAHRRAARGERREAVALMQRVLELDPKSAAYWFNLGYLHQELEEPEHALLAFDRAIALDDRLDRAFYGKAITLIKLGRVDEAIPLLTKNTELQPLSPYGYYQLAHAYHRLGKRERVVRTIRRLAQFEPKVAKQLERETGVDAGIPDPYA